jgi:hypothetical protein
MRGATELEFIDLRNELVRSTPGIEKMHTLQTRPRRQGVGEEEGHLSRVSLQSLVH